MDEQTEEDLKKFEQSNPLTEKMKSVNPKTLVKLYQNNYTQILKDFKKDIEKEKNQTLLTETSNKLAKGIIDKNSFYFPKNNNL